MNSVGLVIVLSASIVHAQEPRVTLMLGATRMPVVLEKLSKLSEVELNSSPALEDEVLFVSVKDAPLNELMNEIAQVTHCSWEKKTNGGFELIRPSRQASRDVADDRALNLALLRKALASDEVRGRRKPWSPEEGGASLERMHEINGRLASGKEPPANREADYRTINELSVVNRAVDRLLAATDLSIFADQRPWEYRRYFPNANQFQFVLPDSAVATLGGFVTEEQYLQAKIGDIHGSDRFQVAQKFGSFGFYEQPVQPPILVLVKTRLIAPPQFDWEVLFCDGEGRLIESGHKIASVLPEPDLRTLVGIEQWGKVKVAFPRFVARLYTGVPGTNSQAEKFLVAHPLEHDPLGAVFDDALTSLGAGLHQDIVAALPDECMQDVARSEVSLSDFCKGLGSWVTFRADNGRLLLTPIRRAEAFDLRAKRRPLEALLKACGNGLPTIEDAATYVLAQNDNACYSPLESNVLGWNDAAPYVEPAIMPICGGLPSQRFQLKFYGLLSDAQKVRMTAGGVRYGELAPDQQDLVAHWVYATSDRFDARPTDAELNAERAAGRTGERLQLPELAGEPTIGLAGGIPNNALIKLDVQKSHSLFLLGQQVGQKVWDCSSIGYVAARQEHGEWLDGLGGSPIVSRYKMEPAWQRHLAFSIQYSPHLSERFFMSDASLAETNAVSMEQLPAAWLSEVNETLNYYRKMFKNDDARQQQTTPP